MNYKFLLILFILFNVVFMSGCILEKLEENRIDYSGEISALKAEKEILLAQKEKLFDMIASVIEKSKTGEIEIKDAQLLFAEINLTKDKVSESIGNVESKIKDMTDKAKEKSKETGYPWWLILIMNAGATWFGIRKRTKFGMSEPGYKHNI